jgi:hypothetical protein
MNLGYRTIDVYKRYAAPKDEILNALEAQIRSLEKPDSWGTPPVKELKIQRTIHGLKINMQAPILGTHPPNTSPPKPKFFCQPSFPFTREFVLDYQGERTPNQSQY